MGVKINVPLILLLAAQIAILVFGIIELKNPGDNWAYYNRHGVQKTQSGGCPWSTFKHRPSHIDDGPHPNTGGKEPLEEPQSVSSESFEDSNSIDEQSSFESSEQQSILKNDVQKRFTVSYNRQHHKAPLPRPVWVELGWKSWCSQFMCGQLLYGAGAIAKDAALYGAVTSIVGSILMIIFTASISINDNKRLVNTKILFCVVFLLLAFLLAATTASWIVWVVHVHKYIHVIDTSYSVTYGFCFVLAILSSTMELFSIFLICLSRWRLGMEIPIGDDAEEEAYYQKLHSQRVATLL